MIGSALVGTPPIGSIVEMTRYRPVAADRLLSDSALAEGSSIQRLCWSGETGRLRLKSLKAELAEWWPDRFGGPPMLVWRLSGTGLEGRLEVIPPDGRSDDPPGILASRIGPGLSPDLRIGSSTSREIVVDDSNITDHLGDHRTPLLTTPDLVEGMERVAAQLLETYILDGYGALGVHNDIAHSGPAFPGETVRSHAVLTGVDGRRLVYSVTSAVGDREIGHGRHESYIVRRTVGTRPR